MLDSSNPLQDNLNGSCFSPIMVFLPPPDLVTAKRVCKSWHNFIESEFGPDLWAIRMSGEGRSCSTVLGEYSCYHLTFPESQQMIILGRNMTNRGFTHILPRFPLALKTITFVNADKMTAHGFQELKQRIGNIVTNLNIWNCSNLTKSDLSFVIGTWKNLTSLSLRHCPELTGAQLRPLLQSLTASIQRLELVDCQKLKPRDFSSLNHASQLIHLTIRRCAGLTDSVFGAIISCLPSLRELDISHNPSLTDQACSFLVKSSLELNSLRLNCPQFTRVSLGHLASIPRERMPQTVSLGGQESSFEDLLCSVISPTDSLNKLNIEPWVESIIVEQGVINSLEDIRLIAGKLPATLVSFCMVWPSNLDNTLLEQMLKGLPKTLKGLNIVSTDTENRKSFRLRTISDLLPPNLRELTLNNFYFASQSDWIHLVKNLPKYLTNFHLINCQATSNKEFAEFIREFSKLLPRDLSKLVIEGGYRFSSPVMKQFIAHLPSKLKTFQFDHEFDSDLLKLLSEKLPPTIVEIKIKFKGSSSDKMNEGMVRFFEVLPKDLRRLDLPFMMDRSVIFSLSKCSKLEVLDFSQSPITDKNIEILGPAFPENLEELSLKNFRYLTPHGFGLLATYLPQNLQKLDLSRSINERNFRDFQDESLVALSPGLPFNLKELNLSGNNFFSFQGFATLANHFPPCLERLDLSGCNLDDNTLTYLAPRLPLELKALVVGSISATEKGFVVLGNHLPPGLNILFLDKCKELNDIAIQAIAEGLTSEIMNINLGGNKKITDEGFVFLGQKLQHSLNRLNLSGCSGLGDKGLMALLNNALRKVRQLNFIGCSKISDVGYQTLAQKMPVDLVELQLGSSQIGLNALCAIFSSLPPSMQTLNIVNCTVINEDNETKNKFVFPPKLQQLSLQGIKIDDQNMGILIKNLPPSLWNLDLNSCNISETNILTLISSMPKNLIQLNLNNCQLSATILEKLISNLPSGFDKLYLNANYYQLDGLEVIRECPFIEWVR